VTTHYVYDVSGGLPVLLDDGARKYVWGAQRLAYTVDTTSGAVTTYHADGLGSVRALTDRTGTVVQTYGSNAWGVPVAAQTTGSVSQPMQFTREPRNPTGLVYVCVCQPGVAHFDAREWPTCWRMIRDGR
jgi:uncharacterized protein RhaS with RHS repeats